jgi:hypothetical protein
MLNSLIFLFFVCCQKSKKTDKDTRGDGGGKNRVDFLKDKLYLQNNEKTRRKSGEKIV